MGHEKDPDKEMGIVMDTPERTQIAAPVSKFEDSPVFNYINSLSPIQPVKSVHFTQTFSTLSFASLPTVFTSPHVSSLKDSKFLKRHQFSDPSKPELTSDDLKKAETSDGNLNATQNPLTQQTDLNSRNTISDTSVLPSNVCSNIESRKLSYEPVRLDANLIKTASQSTSSVLFINNRSENGSFNIENVGGINNLSNNKEASTCDWDSLISDDSELLNFNSPSDTVPYAGPSQNALHELHPNGDNITENDEGLKGAVDNSVTITDISLNDIEVGEPVEDADNEGGSNIYRGMRRRLLFEMTGSRRKHLEDISNGNSANVSEANQPVAPSDNNSSRCILPGIGLHLNSIASNLVDQKVVSLESSGSGRQLIISPPVSFHSIGSGQDLMTSLNDMPSFEENIGPALNVVEEGSKGFLVNDELSQSQTSPRKKRRRAENAEVEACKRCNCKKSKCLKLYCECFAAGVYCVEPCSCLECFNKPIHEDTVLATRKQIESRNPLAFAPKVIKASDPMQEDESSNTPASARHKRGCNCKKSGCLKKYCECYQGGVGCSINCRCEGCKNTFGRKDGSDVDLDFNECDGNASDGSLQTVLHMETEPVSATPATPSRFGSSRQSIPLMNTKGKPPRSFLAIGSSSNPRFGKLNSFKIGGGKPLQTVGENEVADVFEENHGSPISGVKSSSPNSKRVSPPHNSIMGQRSSRKLILQSIPSFPCLTPNTNQ